MSMTFKTLELGIDRIDVFLTARNRKCPITVIFFGKVFVVSIFGIKSVALLFIFRVPKIVVFGRISLVL